MRRLGNCSMTIGRRLFDSDFALGLEPHDKTTLLIDAALGTVQVGQAGRDVMDPTVESRQGELQTHAEVFVQLL